MIKNEPLKATKTRKLTKKQDTLPIEPQKESVLLTDLAAQKQRLERSLWDLAGLGLLVVGMISLLGVLKITKGSAVNPFVLNFARWFGMGRYILPLILLGLGWGILLWRKSSVKSMGLGQLILLEISFFLLLAALSAFNNDTIILVENGKSAGGMVGWGVSAPLIGLTGRIAAGIGFALLTAFCLLLGLQLPEKIEQWARGRLGEEIFSTTIPQETLQTFHLTTAMEDSIADPGTKHPPLQTSSQPPLPLEYVKHLKPQRVEKATSITQAKRSELLPPLSLLIPEKTVIANQATVNLNAGMIEKTLSEFGIPAKVVGYRVGPTVTQYAVEPGYIEKGTSDDRQKIRISQISALNRDLALALKAERLRIEAPVPGKSYVGIEVPNTEHTIVRLRPILESEAFMRTNSPLTIPLGRDVSGTPVVSDLATMPHLLIAGTTNSGKSICIAAITTCLVMNNSPEDLRLVMIDPKMVELTRFNGLPHILGQVETNVERIMAVLRWATTEMDNRYKLLEKSHARNLDSYNARVESSGGTRLPRVVIMVDELADLMMNAQEQTETSLVRLAQKARAVGMHLVVATQRPSTDVVTGVIKANFPTRIAFTVASSVDSRVILDTSGAETLLGRGDMLFLHPEVGVPQRSQGVLVTDQEVRCVIQWWQDQANDSKLPLPSINEKASKAVESEAIAPAPWEAELQESSAENSDEALIKQAIELLRKERRASASYLQRQLRIGYPKAAWLIDQLEIRGVLGPAQSGGKDREIHLDNEPSQLNE